MKNLNFALILTAFLALTGCGNRDTDKFDLAAEKAAKAKSDPSGKAFQTIDVNSFKEEEVMIPKGELLPDGKIADKDTKTKVLVIPPEGLKTTTREAR